MSVRSGSPLKEIRVALSEDLLGRIDAVAASHESRGAMVRALLARAIEEPALALITPKRLRKRTASAGLHLTEKELAALDQESASMGLSRSGWVSALIRRRISRKPTLDRTDQFCLVAMQSDLRRTAANVNQIARSLDAAASNGAEVSLDVQYFHALRAEIRTYITALRDAIDGNLAYWDVEG